MIKTEDEYCYLVHTKRSRIILTLVISAAQNYNWESLRFIYFYRRILVEIVEIYSFQYQNFQKRFVIQEDLGFKVQLFLYIYCSLFCLWLQCTGFKLWCNQQRTPYNTRSCKHGASKHSFSRIRLAPDLFHLNDASFQLSPLHLIVQCASMVHDPSFRLQAALSAPFKGVPPPNCAQIVHAPFRPVVQKRSV